MESCYGCGIRAETGHPVVAVMQFDEAEPTHIATDPAKLWMAVPICIPCHTTPSHRTLVVKGAYFMKADMAVALRLADMQNVRLPGPTK